jgi:hypothetical protein
MFYTSETGARQNNISEFLFRVAKGCSRLNRLRNNDIRNNLRTVGIQEIRNLNKTWLNIFRECKITGFKI